jgi:uroporphyrinogen-III synthase
MAGHARALAGRRVVITRAADQQSRLADLLRERGAVPVEVPLIDIVTDEPESERLGSLEPAAFDWLVVSSPNGARHFLAAHPHAASAPPNVAAVGTVTAAALEQAGVAVALVPQRQSADGLLAEFPAPPEPGPPGRVLLVQAADAAPTLAAGLAATGWAVTAVAPYRSVPAHPSAGR